jgi:hypothetical protein
MRAIILLIAAVSTPTLAICEVREDMVQDLCHHCTQNRTFVDRSFCAGFVAGVAHLHRSWS